MNAILTVESPDLVVINGDLITGENTFLHNSTHYLDEIVAPLVSRGLLWASTYGNHDSNFNLSRKDLFQREKRYPNSLTEHMIEPSVDVGLTNYYLPVFSSDTSKKTPSLLVWFFDSRGGREFQTVDANNNTVGIPEHVHESVSCPQKFRLGSGTCKDGLLADMLTSRLLTGLHRPRPSSTRNGAIFRRSLLSISPPTQCLPFKNKESILTRSPALTMMCHWRHKIQA